jgi:hypothetical protein
VKDLKKLVKQVNIQEEHNDGERKSEEEFIQVGQPVGM